MRDQIKRLIEISHYSDKVLQQITNRQASAPKGILETRKRNDRIELYHYIDKETPRKYLSKSQAPLIAELVQKRYDQQAYALIETKKIAVDKCIKILQEADEKKLIAIYESFPPKLRPLITPIQGCDENYAKKWQARVYQKSTRKIEKTFKTKRGELVRSKSELIIADKLYAAGIPYHYETLFSPNFFVTLSPDFLVLNKRTKKEYYWEHFGKMGEAKYLDETLSKLESYAEHGFFQGINLITTFEFSEHPINTIYLDWIIEKYLK